MEPNVTTFAPFTPEQLPNYYGFILLMVSAIFFGSNYLPVKHFETGDGLFFQFVLCTGIWTVGFVVNYIQNFPQMYALPMLGGALWCTGNVNTVLILKTIGIGLGMLFWGTTSLVIGWANARFGWFGVKPEIPSNPMLNYAGVAFSLFSALFYLLVKSETSSQSSSFEREPLLSGSNNISDEVIHNTTSDSEPSFSQPVLPVNQQSEFISRLNPNLKRTIGTALAIISGVIYGVCNTTILYVEDNYPNASQNNLDYIFSFYTGILITSTFYFFVYCLVKKNRPVINPQVAFPGYLSGLMWGVANISYFIATNSLSQAITFPITASLPPMIASLWGIFLFKEVKGSRNLAIMCAGFVFAIIGSVCNGVSK